MDNGMERGAGIPNILVVDDVAANLKLLGEILKTEGYKVRQVPHGELALQVAAREKPDLILLDVMMPGMDGYEVCRRLKADPGLADIPVIFISALDGTNDIVTALALGGVDYIGKPFVAEEVKARIRTHLKLYLQGKELRESNATKDKFFSIIAHDLRGPFAGFLGATQLMFEQLPDLSQSEIRQFAKGLNESASNLFRLLENLLEWARLQRGLTSFELRHFPLIGLVEKSIGLVSDSAMKKGVEIRIDIPEGLEVVADEYMLESILRNLASNAVKFTRKGGEVAIVAKQAADASVALSVSDTGIGMDSAMAAGLFRIDAQNNRRGTEGEASSGLGLIICKDFVERHGGRLWVESEEGVGSSFHFTLPTGIPDPDRPRSPMAVPGATG
ncbi:MAG: hybrid sensor histidine kinase/response regulator [Rectinemataceae bacterium]